MASGSDQVIQLVEVAAGDSASTILWSLKEEELQEILTQRIGFQADLRSSLKPVIDKKIGEFLQQRTSPKIELEEYFKKVYGYSLSLDGFSFQKQNHLPVFMAIPPDLNIDDIFTTGCSHFGIVGYTPIPTSQYIDQSKEQARPGGLYVIAHLGHKEPDRIHEEKDWEKATEEGLRFLNIKEYLLCFFFQIFKHGHSQAFDQFSTTYTSSIWKDESRVDVEFLVGVRSTPGGRKLYLCRNANVPFIGRGPRECLWWDV
jgi:hypothetical protein